MDTPAYPKIYDYALKSAGAGISVARAALNGFVPIPPVAPVISTLLCSSLTVIV